MDGAHEQFDVDLYEAAPGHRDAPVFHAVIDRKQLLKIKKTRDDKYFISNTYLILGHEGEMDGETLLKTLKIYFQTDFREITLLQLMMITFTSI